MYELIQVGAKTYYINCPAKMGIYLINDKDVCLIDSGNDKDTAKKVLKIISANNWELKTIINTHSHADHIGGNAYLQEKTACSIYSVGLDICFANNAILEASFLYGGYPFKELKNKFLYAQASKVEELTSENIANGLEFLRTDGHSFAMLAIKTSDDIWFLADCFSGKNIIEKYHITFLYDVEAYLNSLDLVAKLEGKLFVPSHAEATDNIQELVEVNKAKTREIIELIKNICKEPIRFEDILTKVFNHYALVMDCNQYVLVGSTIRSYLAYLHNQDLLEIVIENNSFFWKTK